MCAAHKSESPLAGGQIAKENTGNDSDSNATAQITRVIARLTLAGFSVHSLAVGGFLVSRWNLTRYCGDLRSLADFSKQVGAVE
jgi:hypothetical protein